MDTIKDYLKPELIWSLVGILLLLLEFVMPGLIVFFFGVGALAVAVVCLFVDIGVNVQLLVFIGVSVLSLVLLRKWLKGIFMGYVSSKQSSGANIDEFVGERAVVKEKITPNLPGKVELHGTNWQAAADQEINEGAVVEIVGKDNITLKVKIL